jgi:hypothetical protein
MDFSTCPLYIFAEHTTSQAMNLRSRFEQSKIIRASTLFEEEDTSLALNLPILLVHAGSIVRRL